MSVGATVDAIAKRRAAEDEKLNAALIEVRELRAALTARESEILALLGEKPKHAPLAAKPATVKCADCGAIDIRHDPPPAECPVCSASPFEEAQ